MEDPKRILVTRIRQIGDVILTLPLVDALPDEQPPAVVASATPMPSESTMPNAARPWWALSMAGSIAQIGPARGTSLSALPGQRAAVCTSTQRWMSARTTFLSRSLRRSWKAPSYSFNVLSGEPAAL